MTAVTPEKIAEWRGLADAATKGPWEVGVWGHDHGEDFDGQSSWYLLPAGEDEHPGVLQSFGDLFRPWLAKGDHKANVEFAAASREAVPALLDDVERLQEELQAWAGPAQSLCSAHRLPHAGCRICDASVRLREDVERLTRERDEALLANGTKALRAENARMREALEAANDWLCAIQMDDGYAPGKVAAFAKVRAALAGKP